MRFTISLVILLLEVVFLPNLGRSQGVYWNNIYDYAGGTERDVNVVYADSCIYALSEFFSSTDNDLRVALSKVDPDGNMVWTRVFEESGFQLESDRGFSMTDSVLCFHMNRLDTEFYDTVYYVSKMNLAGDTLFYKKYTSQIPQRIVSSKILKDGSVALTGYKAIHKDTLYWSFQKIDANGSIVWDHIYPNAGLNGIGFSISTTNDGGFVLGGYSKDYVPNKYYQGITIKTDSSGYVEWIRDFGNRWTDAACMVTTVDTFIYVAGSQNLKGDDNYPWEGEWQSYLAKYSLKGQKKWLKFFGPVVGPFGGVNDVQVLTSGDVVVAGFQPDISGWPTGWIYKHTSAGDSVWERYYDYVSGFKHDHRIQSVVELSDQSLVTGGYVYPHPTFWDSVQPSLWLMRLDTLGCGFEGCDTVCVEPDITYQIDVKPNLEVVIRNTTRNMVISAIWISEPPWGSTETVDTIAQYFLHEPGSIDITFVIEGPCNLPIYWDTTIFVDYVGTPVVEGKELNLHLYPNPATQILNLQWQGGTPAGTVSLYDLQGREVLQQAIHDASTHMDISGLAAALYLAIIRDEKGRVIWRKKVMIR